MAAEKSAALESNADGDETILGEGGKAKTTEVSKPTAAPIKKKIKPKI